MSFVSGKHVYLAAPFFNDVQRGLCTRIEERAAKHQEDGLLHIYSPRNDGFVLTPDASNEDRKEIFDSNTAAIDAAAWVLAVIDDFDAGVLWEMGYAFAQDVPVLGYSDVAGRGLNVMLAGSCELGFVNGWDTLRALLDQVNNGVHYTKVMPYNTWRGEVQ